MIEPAHPRLSIARQCRLVSIGRSGYYGPVRGESSLNLALMRPIDEQFLETPWYGSRQMARHLRRQGHVVGMPVHRPRVRWDIFDGLTRADGGAGMDDGGRGGAAGAETSRAGAALGRERRMTAGRKGDAVLRVLRGEPLEIVARELAVTAADLSAWRDAFLDAGEASLKTRARDDRDETIGRLRAKVGALTMDNELLHTKVERLEGGVPFAGRRSRR